MTETVALQHCPAELLPAGVAAAVTQAPDDLRLAARRQVLQRQLGLARLQCLRQVHGQHVVRAVAPADAAVGGDCGSPSEPEADAVWTSAAGVACAVLTADCLPVILVAEDGSRVAAAHAGWRGLAGGVLEAALVALELPPSACRAWLGPAIGQASFEVGPEVRAAFMDAARAGAGAPDAIAAAFRPGRADRWHGDLYALARARLRAAGLRRIDGGGADTFTDPQWHSFRRDGQAAGRQLTLVWRIEHPHS